MAMQRPPRSVRRHRRKIRADLAQRRRTLCLELLEDRRLLAVSGADVSAALGTLNTQLDQAFESRDDVFGQNTLPVFQQSLDSVIELAPQIQGAVQAVQNGLGNEMGAALKTALETIANNNAAVDITVDGTPAADITFTITLTPTPGPFQIPVDNSPDFGPFLIDFPAQPPVDIDNVVTATAKLTVDDMGNITFSRDDTSIEYRPSINRSITANGDAIGGKVTFDGTIDVAFGPVFTLGFGTGNAPLANLPGLAEAPTINGPPLTIDVMGNVTANPLPTFTYVTQFTGFNFTQGTEQILFNGQDVTNAGEAAWTSAVIDAVAPGLLDRIGGFVPQPIADLLLGNTVVFGSVTLNDLIPGDVTPLDLIGRVVGGAPAGTALANLLEVYLTLTSQNSLNSAELASRANELGLQFPLVDNPVSTALGILGGTPVDLVTLRLDLAEFLAREFAAEFGIPANDVAALLQEIPQITTAANGLHRIDVDFDFPGLKGIVESVLGDVPSGIRTLIDRVIDIVGDVTLSFDFEAQVGLVAGIDSTFLTSGATVSSIGQSFFVDSEDIVDIKFDVSGTLSQGVGFGLGGFLDPEGDGCNVGNLGKCDKPDPGDVIDVDGFVEGLNEAGQPFIATIEGIGEFLETLTGDLARGSITARVAGDFNLSLNDPDGNGRLTGTEVVDILNSPSCHPLGLIEITTNLSGSLSAEGTVTGVQLGPLSVGGEIGFNLGGCALVNSSGGANPDGTPANLNGFAELVGGELRVFGRSDDNTIDIRRDNSDILVKFDALQESFPVASVTSLKVDLRGGTPDDGNIISEDGGNDTVNLFPDLPNIPAMVLGGSGGDFITSNPEGDAFFGGDLTVEGGDGLDVIVGSAGRSILRGENGPDFLFAGPGEADLFGGADDDQLRGMQSGTGLPPSPNGGLMVGGGGTDILAVGPESRGAFTLVGGSLDGDDGSADDGNWLIGGFGDDLLIVGDAVSGSAVPVAGSGQSSVAAGGPGDDTIHGGAGEDVLVGGWFDSTEDAGFNTLFGNGEDDLLITPNAAITPEGQFVADTAHAGSGVAEGGPGNDILLGGAEADLLQGQAGDDQAFGDRGDDVIVFDVGGNDVIDGGPPGASDALFVDFDATDEFVVIKQSRRPDEGVVRVYKGGTLFATASFIDTEVVSANVHDGPFGRQVLSMKPDFFEQNEFVETAADLGSGEVINVPDLQIFPPFNEFPLFPDIPEDQDFFRVRAQHSGTLDVVLEYRHVSDQLLPGGGDVDLEVLDASGNSIEASVGAVGRERVTIPVVQDEVYVIRAHGAFFNVLNAYDLTIINTPAPVPLLVDLQAASDSGRDSDDEITNDTTPTLDIYLDDDRLESFTQQDLEPDTDFFVDVFNNGVLLGTASFQGPAAGVADNSRWQFTAAAGALQEGDNNYVTAAVRIVDATSAEGRGGFSTPLQVTLDTIAPLPPGLAIDPDATDTGIVDQPQTLVDRITSDTASGFGGQTERQAIVRLFADAVDNSGVDNPAVFGSVDASDAGLWYTHFPHDLNDPQLFARDGLREMAATSEDVAGNVSPPAFLDVFVDTVGPKVAAVSYENSNSVFDPKADGPTPRVDSLLVTFDDLRPETTIMLGGPITGDQEVPPVTTSASAVADLLFDPDTGEFSLDIFALGLDISDNSAPNFLTMAHIHLGAPGENGGILVDLGGAAQWVADGAGIRRTISGQAFPAANVDDLLSGTTYINLHTNANTSGEIRGQLDVEFNYAGANAALALNAANYKLVGDHVGHVLIESVELAPTGGLVSGSEPDVVFVIDVSGSTSNSFGGSPVGDVNNDGDANTILDAELAGFLALNQDLINQGLGDIADVAIVIFSSTGSQVDMDTVAAGTQLSTTPNADADGNGTSDVEDILRSLTAGGTTNFADALADAINTFNALGTTPPNGNLIFLSDGLPNQGGDHSDEAAAVQALANNVRAFGVGTGSSLPALQIIDPNAFQFTTTDELLQVFAGTGTGTGNGTQQPDFGSVTRVRLRLTEPLPDDRYALTVFDRIRDQPGNALDGDERASSPGEPAQLIPSGDETPGGTFAGRFTVDSRVEFGTISQSSVFVDINGNFVFDPQGKDNDRTNRDLIFNFGEATDAYFAGNFAPAGATQASGFDKLGAYGFFNGRYMFVLDFDHDGVADGAFPMPNQPGFNVNAVPVAGNFAANHPGEEIGAYDGTHWFLDSNGNNLIEVGERFAADRRGIPVVGDFNGDGADDLALFNNATNVFSFDLNRDGVTDDTLTFGFSGFGDIPIAGDLNLDGIDDIGLWVPGRQGQLPEEAGEWYFLVSDRIDDLPSNVFTEFSPAPLGNDLFAQFGDDSALPILGNFDPPTTSQAQQPQSTPAFKNPNRAEDVSGDGHVAPLDALIVINTLNGGTTQLVPVVRALATMGGFYYVDVNGDTQLSSNDALRVINALNQNAAAEAEGEGAAGRSAHQASTPQIDPQRGWAISERENTRAADAKQGETPLGEETVEPLIARSAAAHRAYGRAADRVFACLDDQHDLLEAVDQLLRDLGSELD